MVARTAEFTLDSLLVIATAGVRVVARAAEFTPDSLLAIETWQARRQGGAGVASSRVGVDWNIFPPLKDETS